MKKIVSRLSIAVSLLISTTSFSKTNDIRVQLKPAVFQGDIQGFSIYDISKDPVLKKMGFKKDDVIMAVNGIKLHSVTQANEAINDLYTKEVSKVHIYRNYKHYVYNVKNKEAVKWKK